MQKKRRFVRNVFASLLATLTAFSPALSVIPVYADEEDDGIKVQKSDDGIQVSNSDKKTVAIDIDGVNGELVIDAGRKDEQTVRVSDAKDKNGKEIKKASITDADGNITEAEVNSDNPHAIVLTEETGKVVTVQAKADAGFEVAQYKILMDSGTKSEDTGFDANKYSAFTYDITFDADKTVTVGFKKADEGIKLESNVSDITVEKDTETSDDVKVEKDDEDQSVNVPVIQTSATIDGAKSADASKDSTVVDTVSYHNLVPGREYEMRGVLMDKSTGKSTGVTAVQKFTPDKADGTVEITFKIDTTAYVGRQLVVFEELVSNDENGTAYVVAQHKDINDAAQTVTVTNPPEDKVTPSIDTSDFSTIGYVIGGVAMVLLLAGLAVLRKKKFHA